MTEKLYVKFENLDDMKQTLDTLYSTIEKLLNYYRKVSVEACIAFLKEMTFYVWAVYIGAEVELNKDGTEDGQ
jgi:hypothetical protein